MNEYLPNPCLLGIQLIISTHSGPQVVYHYPPASVEYISNKQRQSRQHSTGIDDSGSTGKIYAGNLQKKPSIAASLTGQSFVSGEHRTPDEDNLKSPSIRSSGTASVRRRRTHSIDSGKVRNVKENYSSSSDPDSSSSGLSDSELSTDYVDESSDLSTSSDSERTEEQAAFDVQERRMNELRPSSTNSTNKYAISESARTVRPKSSQISASKLLEIFNKDGSDRRSSAVSRTSTPRTVPSSDNEDDEDRRSELDYSELNEKGKIGLNEQYFAENVFQDLNKIFGFDPEFVAEFCSPEREMCNTRYEFTVDTLCFLGLPIHVDQHGNWRKSKRKKQTTRSKRSSSTTTRISKQRSNVSQPEGSNNGTGLARIEGSPTRDDDEGSQSGGDHNSENQIPELSKEDLEKNMNMFHVCFVMNPLLVEYNQRIDDMFHYAVARLSMLLRYAQAKSNYVSRECHIIMKEKERVLKHSKTYKSIKGAHNRGKYLYQRILVKSSLARALTLCVEKLQKNDIACLEIGDDKVMALQIPIQNEFSVLPNFKLHPVLRGSYLSTILNSRFLSAPPSRDDSLNDYSNAEDEDANDLLHLALLLLDEPANIIKELETFSYQDDIGNIVLTHIVKHIQPNVPLGSYQHLIDELLGGTSEDTGIGNSFQTSMLRSCALHLLYQRHARVVIPISSRNTYIVSPIAPIRGYSKNDYMGARFSGMPLIYQNQGIFKGKFPTLPSLPSFLQLLSTGRPKPYGSIIPSKEHKSIYLGALSWLLRYGYVTQLLTFVCIRVDRQIKMAVDEDLEREGFKAKTHTIDRDHGVMDNVAKNAKNDVVKTDRRAYSNEETEDDIAQFEYDDPDIGRDYTIILEPERATAIEKRWMFKCVQDQPSEVQKLFSKVLKYFNGRIPMELVVLREALSRHEIKKLVGALDGYLVEYYHW
ncbi:NPR3 (YHL023C) [Zygosaccharomyces parabailii]|nr:NPR3 (YHL023C) [Zygosaccharomyces parabailii]